MPNMPTRATRTKSFKEEKPVIEQEFPEDEDFEEPVIKQEETFSFKASHFYSLVTVLAFATGVLLGYVVWGLEAPAAEEPQFIRYDIPIEGAYALGPKDAPITIVEFSDYQCPFCRRWHDEVYQSLLAAYPGKIKLVYRHLPLTTIHPDALSAAEAAMCAGEQDAYWQYHEKLFSSDALGTSVYMQYAQEIGLNTQNFETCITEHRYREVIQADSDFAVDLGVRSTPTFFINGLAIVGAQPLNAFKQIIDKELAGEIPQ
jgi:predicted DsbA family dithiol-disulfide isomerase